jgi:hypothetical protein
VVKVKNDSSEVDFVLSKKKENITGLSFGIMCLGQDIQAWQAECIRLLLAEGHECKLLIIDANETPKKTTAQKFRGYFSSTGMYHFYQRFFFRPKAKSQKSINSILKLISEETPFPSRGRVGDGVNLESPSPSRGRVGDGVNLETPVHLKGRVGPALPVGRDEVKSLHCTTTKKKYSEYFSDTIIENIKSHQLDFILRFGFNIIRGEILNAAKFGVWSFHHDDEQKYRGGPPGFWEILKNDPVTGTILQRLTDKLDGGIILKKGFFKTIDHSYAGQIDQLYFASAEWPLHVCRDIENNVAPYTDDAQSRTNAKVYKAPTNPAMLSFWFKILKNKISFHYQELFKPEDWNVGIAKTSISSFSKNFDANNLTWLPHPPKGRYFADPFAFQIGEELHVVFEDYDYKSRKGKISRIVYSDGKFGEVTSVIEEDFHLSYPFIFETDGDIYCLPESATAKQVRLYKYDQGAGEFRFNILLLDDFPGVDPTVFKYENKWWLFATSKEQSNTDLHVFFAEQFDGPYQPHANNPVKTDVRNARPAGTPYIENCDLMRPAQDCSGTYGGRIAVNKVVELTGKTFIEETINYIGPLTKSKFNKGFHTISMVGDYTIFDGKRFRFSWNNFKDKLKQKLG